MIKAIIFDFDGVLVLSEKARFNAIKKSARKFSIHISETLFKLLVGKTTKVFLHEVLSREQKVHIPTIIEDYQQNYKNNIENFVEPVTMTVEFIKNYKGHIRFALATMSEKHVVEKILRKFGIADKFILIISQKDVINHKPHPEVYLKVINQLGLSVSECIAVEDTVVGMTSATEAGLACYIVLNGGNNKDEFQTRGVKGFITNRSDLELLIR